MRSIAAVRPRRHIPARASRTPRTAMTESTTVGEPCANCAVGIQIADSVANVWTLSLQTGELALKQLATPTDRAIGISPDDEDGGIPGHRVAAAGADLLLQRFRDSGFGGVGRLSLVGELRRQNTRQKTNSNSHA